MLSFIDLISRFLSFKGAILSRVSNFFLLIVLGINLHAQTRDQLFILKVNTNLTTGTTNANNIFRIQMTGNYDVDFSYNGTFDASGTGDSKLNALGTHLHTYASAGTYEIAIRPAGSTNGTGNIRVNYGAFVAGKSDRDKIIEIMEWGAGTWTSMSTSFRHCENLDTIRPSAGAPNLSSATSMEEMFSRCSKLDADISSWNVSNIQNFSGMFSYSEDFNNGGNSLSGWNTSSATNMSSMFDYAKSFNQPVDGWDVRKVTNFSRMFFYIDNFNQPLNSWNIGALTGATAINMSYMFYWTYSFNQPLSNWDVSKVTNFHSMFRGRNSSVKHNFNQDLSSWTPAAGTNFTSILDYTSMSVANYDALLISWSAQSLQSGVTFGAAGLEYCQGTTGRQNIISSNSWTFLGDSQLSGCVVLNPGGVSGAKLWLQANAGAPSTGSVTTWEDQSGNSKNFTTSGFGTGSPSAGVNVMNFNPTITFSSGDALGRNNEAITAFVGSITTGTNTSGTMSMFAVTKQNGAGFIINQWEGVGFANYVFNMEKSSATNVRAAIRTDGVVSSSVVNNTTQMLTSTIAPGSNNAQLWIDGLLSSTGTSISRSVISPHDVTLGGEAKTGDFVGDMSEVILYSSKLSTTNKRRVESYLALKYGITLDQSSAQDYLASDGSDKIWDASAAGGFTNDIFGIGRDNNSGLHQKVSKSINTDAIITLATTNDFSSDNSDVARDTLDDLNFAVIANNGGTAAWTSTGAPTGYNVLNRKWRVQEEDSVGIVHLQFDVADAQFNVPALSNGGIYYLLVDANNNGNYSDDAPIALTNTSGDLWSTAFDFDDGERFTIAEYTGSGAEPGGVAGAALWLKADKVASSQPSNNATITNWESAIGGHTASQATSYRRPTFKELSTYSNFNPAVSFDGTTDFLDIPWSADLNGTKLTIFSVHTLGVSAGGYRSPITCRESSASPSYTENRGYILYKAPSSAYEIWTGRNTAGNWHSLAFTGVTATSEEIDLLSFTVDGTTPTSSAKFTYSEGKQTSTGTQDYHPQNQHSEIPVRIGAGTTEYTGGGAFWKGEITEQIIFSDVLSAIDRRKVEGYLALKYGITLDQTSAQDYLASDGTDKIWDASAAASGFNNDIFGIGRDDDSELNQKVSKSVNSDGIITLATTNDFVSSNSDGSRTALSDLNFEVVSNNGGAASWTSTGAPTDFNILSRQWQVQEEGSIGSVHLQFDVADAQFNVPALTKSGIYYLLVDANNNGNFTDDDLIPLTNTSGDLWSTSFNFDNGERFTLAEFTGASPAGVGGASLWLKASEGVTGTTSVTQWDDQSGNGHNFTSSGGNTPSTSSSSNLMNFNPSISLGLADYMTLQNDQLDLVDEVDFYIVRRELNQTGSAANNKMFWFGAAPDFNGHSGFSIHIENNDKDRYVLFNVATNDYGSIDNEENIIQLNSINGDGTNSKIEENGNVVTSNTYTPSALASSLDVFIGASRTSSSWGSYIGDIAEIIFYPQSNSSGSNRAKIESYLALKYGITLHQTPAQDYLASDGTDKIWDASSAAAGFNNGIFGIGRDDESELHQRISKSSDVGSILTVSTSSDFTSSNQTGTRTDVNGDMRFLVFSNNGLSNSVISAEIPNGTTNNARIAREWQLQKHAWNQVAHLKFEGYNADWRLYKSTSSDFSSGSIVDLGALSASGEISVSNIQLVDGHFYTLAAEFEGPGGIAAVDFWVKADAGTFSDAGSTSSTNDGEVQQWNNQSSLQGPSANVNQTTASNKPLLRHNSINYNPAVDFDGSNDFVSSTNSPLTSNSASEMNIFFVSVEDVRQNSALYDFKTSNSYCYYPWSDGIIYFSPGSGARINTSTSLPLGTPTLAGLHNSVSNSLKEIRVNNEQQASANVGGTETLTRINLGKGHSAFDTYFNGRIAEFMVFGSDLSTTDKLRVQSYLALKYGITLNQTSATDYLASDGTAKIWDASEAEAGYNNNIVGIGRDDNSDLHQRVSKSVNDNIIFSVSSSSDFSSSNQTGSRTNIVNDKSFLVFSDNGVRQSIIDTEIPNGTGHTTRMAREWQLQKENWNQSAHLKFAGLDANWVLYKSTSANFSSGTITNLGALNANGEISVSNANLVDGHFYTLASSNTDLPGGAIGAYFWVRADEPSSITKSGSQVSQWEDLSYNVLIKDQTAVTASANIETIDNSINYNPAINFKANNNGLEGEGFADDWNGALTAYIVAINKTVSPTQPHYTVFSSGRKQFYSRQQIGYQLDAHSFTPTLTTADATTNGSVVTLVYPAGQSTSGTLNGARGYTNGGSVITTNAGNTILTSTEKIGLGKHTDGIPSRNFVGEICEVIVFPENHILDDSKRRSIGSYLALKYGATLSSSGGGANGDYVLSNGTTVWDASFGTDAYQNDVIGVVRDDASNLLQKQSKTPDDSLRLYIGSLAATNQANATAINNNLSSLIIGHNGAAYQAEYSGPNVPSNSQKPSSIYARFERQWKVTNTNFSNTYSLRFQWDEVNNVNLADLRLLVDADGDFTNATVIASGQNGITFSNGSIIVSGIGTGVIPMNTTRFITIGTVSSSTPLPVSLTSFNAEKQGENNALLTWETSSELNNSHFVLERKFENGKFEFLQRVEGNGTSNEFNSYSELDVELESGTYFYRLVQVDFDGQKEYYDIKQVQIGSSKPIEQVVYKIYPNPTSTILNIQSSVEGEYSISIFDNLGKVILSKSNLLTPNIAEQIDVSSLENGMYYIQINEERIRFVIQR